MAAEWITQVADWCQRSLDEARRTGHLETRPFVQNAELIIAALRAYDGPYPKSDKEEE